MERIGYILEFYIIGWSSNKNKQQDKMCQGQEKRVKRQRKRWKTNEGKGNKRRTSKREKVEVEEREEALRK